MKKVLFVCIENSNRSQMAEAFGKIHSPSPSLPDSPSRSAMAEQGGESEKQIQFFSAGSRPSGKINEKAIDAMKEIGYDLTKHNSKSVNDFRNNDFEYVVTMGCGDECPFIPAKHRLDWQIPQPKDMDKDEFRKVRDEIEKKVKDLLSNPDIYRD